MNNWTPPLFQGGLISESIFTLLPFSTNCVKSMSLNFSILNENMWLVIEDFYQSENTFWD